MIVEAKPAAKQTLYDLTAIAIAVSFTFYFGLGNLALAGPDEPRYAEVAREMYASGDFITTTLCGCLWFEKPVLLYWMAAASYYLFGVGEFAARFPSALSATIAVLFLYFAVRKIMSARAAVLSALVLATSGIFISYARAGVTDMVFAVAMSVALLAGYMALNAASYRLYYWSLCGAATGAAMLAKGLPSLVFVVVVIGLQLLITCNLKGVGWKAALVAGLAFIIVASLWYAPVTIKHGWRFIDEFFIQHHFRRYVSDVFGHPQPVYFFPFVAIVGVMPWTFFLIPAAARLRKLDPRASKEDSLIAFCWIWAAVPIIFFSLSESKLPGYILLVFPALAVILGREVSSLWEEVNARPLNLAAYLTAALLLCLGIAFFLYMRRKLAGPEIFDALIYILPLGVAAITVAAIIKKRMRMLVPGLVSVVISIAAGSVMILFPSLNDEVSLKTLSLRAYDALRPGERITFFVKKEFAPVFYAEGRVVCGVGEGTVLNALKEDILAELLMTEPSLIVITVKNFEHGIRNDPRFNMEFIGQQGAALAFRVSLKSGVKAASIF
jgi:4-amino-4-deoxy-L-arabinose transferase-like glycosyltransferase